MRTVVAIGAVQGRMSSFTSKDDRPSISSAGDFSYLDYLVAHHSSGQWSPVAEGVELPRIQRLGEAFAAAWAQEPELELTQQQRQMGGDGLLYGEVRFDSFGVILETVRQQLKALPAAGVGNFCDIGSGTSTILSGIVLHIALSTVLRDNLVYCLLLDEIKPHAT